MQPCSVAALQRMQILGKTKFARIAFIVQFGLLTLAQCWNIWVIITPSSNSTLFRILDMCWLLSNIWMLVIGITALAAKQLRSWKRFVPLFVGLWFPAMVVPAITLGVMTSIAGPYSAVAFALLGLVVYKADEDERIVVNSSAGVA